MFWKLISLLLWFYNNDWLLVYRLHCSTTSSSLGCRTLVSAQCCRPSSLTTLLTRCSRSSWLTDEGSRRAAEKWKFSFTLNVPMTTSSWKKRINKKGEKISYKELRLKYNSNWYMFIVNKKQIYTSSIKNKFKANSHFSLIFNTWFVLQRSSIPYLLVACFFPDMQLSNIPSSLYLQFFFIPIDYPTII